MNTCIVDTGNTRTKIGFFCNDKLNDVSVFENKTIDWKNIIQTLINKEVTSIYLSINNPFLETIKNEILPLRHSRESGNLIEIPNTFPSYIQSYYTTPDTLGIDRIAAIVAANLLKPNQNILIIDAGTAITYDFIDKNNHYHGGAIAPGLFTRYNSLHHFTHKKLPLLNPSTSLRATRSNLNPLGNSTQTCIHSGVENGFLYEVQGFIQFYLHKTSNQLTLFLTGGDADFIQQNIQYQYHKEPNLVLLGLKILANEQLK